MLWWQRRQNQWRSRRKFCLSFCIRKSLFPRHRKNMKITISSLWLPPSHQTTLRCCHITVHFLLQTAMARHHLHSNYWIFLHCVFRSNSGDHSWCQVSIFIVKIGRLFYLYDIVHRHVANSHQSLDYHLIGDWSCQRLQIKQQWPVSYPVVLRVLWLWGEQSTGSWYLHGNMRLLFGSCYRMFAGMSSSGMCKQFLGWRWTTTVYAFIGVLLAILVAALKLSETGAGFGCSTTDADADESEPLLKTELE